jgi:ABC-2 type transport system permease protein
MIALLKKEIRSFLSSLIGYVVMAVFLLITSLFMWIFPGEFNVLMFLIPAVTMRSFSEERRTGTLELLLTKPITDFQIILAKYLAGLILVLISLLPTLLFFLTVYQLGNPPGNVDTGGTWGSYIGLLLLASGYVAIGIFASSISRNQIVAFLLAVLLTFFMYMGFSSIGSFELLGTLDDFIIKLGMQHHFASLSMGLIDSRNVIYFIALIAIFFIFTNTVLKSRTW